MGRYINPGNDGFTAVRKGMYVDKSGLIGYINGTLGHSHEAFCDLEIAGAESYRRYLNKYNVIYLDLTWFVTTVKDIRDVVCYLQRKVTWELKAMFPRCQKEGRRMGIEHMALYGNDLEAARTRWMG